MPTNKCSVLKRIYAFLINFVLVLITSLVFEMACSILLFKVCFSFQDKCSTLIVEQVKTGLYYFVDENFVIVANDENTEEDKLIKALYNNDKNYMAHFEHNLEKVFLDKQKN